MMKSDRPIIPAGIKREVRKRCGFGCVLCGKPLYDYDHIVDWSKVKEHKADNITLLCRLHHNEKTAKLLPIERVIKANKYPINLKRGKSTPHLLHYDGENCAAVLGPMEFTFELKLENDFMIPLIIDNVPIIQFRRVDDQLLLSLQIFDNDNNLSVQVIDNEIWYLAELWDVDLVGRELTVRYQLKDLLLRMRIEVPNKISIDRANFCRNGIKVDINDKVFFLSNNNTGFSDITYTNCLVGLALGDIPDALPYA